MHSPGGWIFTKVGRLAAGVHYIALGSNECPALSGKCNAIEDEAH